MARLSKTRGLWFKVTGRRSFKSLIIKIKYPTEWFIFGLALSGGGGIKQNHYI